MSSRPGSSFTIKYKTAHNPQGGKSQTQRRSGNNRNRRSYGKKKNSTIDTSRFVNKIDQLQVAATRDYEPTHLYKDFAFESRVHRAVTNKGFETPTEIQDKAIPLILKGKDIVGLSATGTGKTAAFLLPILDKLFRCKIRQALIVAPTRELAMQINDELHALHKRNMFVFSTVLVGGLPVWRQIKQLRKGKQHVIIGTPGRIMDLLDRGNVSLEEADMVVLDEADRMLDMGFRDDIRYIMKHVPEKRQTVFFSATMSSDIKELIGEFLNNPETVSVKKRETSEMVDQDIVRLNGRSRLDVLVEALPSQGEHKTIVFTETKKDADRIASDLKALAINADAIHGDRDHWERQAALRNFIDGSTDVLVATDVAARGLDIYGVTHVINYHPPREYEDYVHRIGRTGRAGAVGKALTIVD